MKLRVRISGKGTQAIIKGIDDYGKDIQDRAKTEVKRWADETFKASQADVPIRTGELRRSGGLLVMNGGKGAKVFYNAFHAPFLEFGTGAFVDVPPGLERYAIQFKGKGIRQVNIPARPYLYTNSRSKFYQMLQRLNDYIKKRSKK